MIGCINGQIMVSLCPSAFSLLFSLTHITETRQPIHIVISNGDEINIT